MSVSFFSLLFAAGGCRTLSQDQSQSPIPDPVELTSANSGWNEITAGVVPAIGAGGGKVFVFGSGKGLTHGLNGGATTDIALPSSAAVGGHWANDQQSIQLAGGDMLLSWNGFSNTFDEEFSKSEWWNKWPTDDGQAPQGVGYPVERNGIRPAELIWRYSAKDDQWSPTVNKLDAALVGAVDNNGSVKRSYCAQGVPWVAGFDRPEFYADPWSVDPANPAKQRLLMSVRCSRSDDDSQQVFVSEDSGATWEDSGIRLPGGMATVAASASGNIFILQGTTIYVSEDHGKTIAPWSKSGFDITTSGFPLAAVQGTESGVGHPWVAPTPISTVGPSSVLAVYPSVETITVKGQAIKRQVAVVVVFIAPSGGDPAPLVLPLTIVRAKDPGGSVILPTLITEDRPLGNVASMMYWLETTGKPATPGTDPTTVIARYLYFGRPAEFPSPIKDLSDPAGFQTTTIDPFGFGDYMKGAFYYDQSKKTLNFIAVWPQQKSDGTVKPFVRVITMTDVPKNNLALTGAKPAPKAVPSPKMVHPCEKCLTRAAKKD
ncbi:MAG TPA: hypothetical protein VF883_02470 [Thermoanaerobaculia bacterium]|jgi:hypothetical protein